MKNNWTIVKVADIVDKVIDNRGKTPPLTDHGYELIEVNAISAKRKYPDYSKVTKFVNENTYNTWFRNGHPKKGDVLIPTVGSVGVSSILAEERGSIAQNIVALRVNSKISSDFFYYFTNSDLFTKQIERVLMGAVQPSLKVPHISNFQIPIPPLEVQQKIAEVLSYFDDAIEKTNEIVEKVELLKTGLMQHLFTFGSNIKKTKLIEILELSQYGLSIKSSISGQYPMFRMNNFDNGKIIPYPLVYVDLDSHSFKEYKLEKGDILFNRTNSHELVGKTGIFELDGDYVFASYLVRLRVKKSLINPYFLNFYMNSPQGKQQIEFLKARGVSQSNINPTTLKNKFTCPVPSLLEQEEIVKILQEIDRKLILEKQTLIHLLDLKKGLMNDIFSRKVEVN